MSRPSDEGTGQYASDDAHALEPLIPDEILYGDEPVIINAGTDVITLRVVNTADRPVQVGSHTTSPRSTQRCGSTATARGASG